MITYWNERVSEEQQELLATTYKNVFLDDSATNNSNEAGNILNRFVVFNVVHTDGLWTMDCSNCIEETEYSFLWYIIHNMEILMNTIIVSPSECWKQRLPRPLSSHMCQVYSGNHTIYTQPIDQSNQRI